jgi:asparagine synthetase B (glutamine-hydrolysing)
MCSSANCEGLTGFLMSKVIYVVSRYGLASDTARRISCICAQLTHHDSLVLEPDIYLSDHLARAVVNPVRSVLSTKQAVAVGAFFGTYKDWAVPGSEVPDGSFALIRSDDDRTEAITDAVASRSLWVYFDNEVFICASSQRAILMYIESFEFNARTVPWILSTGTLGPENSWDRRIRTLRPDSIVTLNRRNWTIQYNCSDIRFETDDKYSSEEAEYHIESSVKRVFDSPWSYCPKTLTVPLSGGYDSRTLLSLLVSGNHRSVEINTVTWGVESNKNVPDSDAYVAKQVASHFGLDNTFIALDAENVAESILLDRFIACSEGRIDHLSGYIDGMALWRRLAQSGIDVIMRGDEGFGWVPQTTERTTRYSLGMGLSTDYGNVFSLLSRSGFDQSTLPDYLKRYKGESLATWRDRMYHAFRIPTVLAALSDLKLSYVEVINPFLAKSILKAVRHCPDASRTKKAAFKAVAERLNPSLDYAKSNAISSPKQILARPALVKYVHGCLCALRETTGELDRKIFDDILLISSHQVSSSIIGKMHSEKDAATNAANTGVRKSLIDLTPDRLKNMARYFKPANVDLRVLVFRFFILVSTINMIKTDRIAIKAACTVR